MNFARKSALLSAATVLSVSLVAPAAQADMVDDRLGKVPAGQISCSQANQYWTNTNDYNNKRSQALLAANFHPRGAEIRDAINRMDNAVDRCNLGGNNAGNGGNNNAAPAPRPAAPTPAQNNNVISVGTIPGQPTFDVQAFGQTFRLPDLARIAQNAFSQLTSQIREQLDQFSSF
ncbi:hypothetical protein VVR26_05270 [Corynebacterium camporealensis]|uniref:hypothetical protein n=1 Tax=Corynebacterium camporealensis TaxID=161896 RepID=UPI0034CE02C6